METVFSTVKIPEIRTEKTVAQSNFMNADT